jgi:transcriptional regulator with XRE-family HTH domain
MILIGAQIKEARELMGWSRAKLAYEAGVSPSSVNRLERGTRRPSAWVEALIVATLAGAENGGGAGVN